MSRVLIVKIGNDLALRGSRKGQGNVEYKNEVNLEDFRKLALFFLDLETFGGKVEKAFQEFKKQKAEEFPW